MCPLARLNMFATFRPVILSTRFSSLFNFRVNSEKTEMPGFKREHGEWMGGGMDLMYALINYFFHY